MRCFTPEQQFCFYKCIQAYCGLILRGLPLFRFKSTISGILSWYFIFKGMELSPKDPHHQRIETVRFKGCASWYSPHSSIANQNGLADLCLELRNLSTKPFSIFFSPLFCDFLQKKRIEWRRKNFYFDQKIHNLKV